MLRIPVVKALYGGSKQLMDALTSKGKRSSSQVLYTIGFVTRETLDGLDPLPASESMSAVFLPTTPNPTSGWIAFLPRRELIPLSVTVEEGVKLVVSGGIVVPPRWEAPAVAASSKAENAPR